MFHNSDFRQVLDQKGLNVDWKCARTAVEKDSQISFSSSPLQPCMENMDKKCFRAHVFLKTVPTIVIAHTFCTSPDTRISYRRYLLIQGYFCAV